MKKTPENYRMNSKEKIQQKESSEIDSEIEKKISQ